MVWYLLRSTGSLRAASARASASEIGVPLRPADLSSPPPLPLAGEGGAGVLRELRSRGGPHPPRYARRPSPQAGEVRDRPICRAPCCVVAVGFDVGRIDLGIFGDPAGQRGEFHRFQERDQLARVGLVHGEFAERHVELDLVVEQHQLPRDPRLFGILDQRLATLRLLDLAGAHRAAFRGRHIRRSIAPRS